MQHFQQIRPRYTPCGVERPELIRCKKSTRTGKPFRSSQCLGKMQVLEAMKCIVMDEVPDRCLAWKRVFEMTDRLPQLVANILCFGRWRRHQTPNTELK